MWVSIVQFSGCKPEKVSDNGDEGTPVPIPNTVVKLVYGDNTWLATAWEDNSSLTLKAVTNMVAAFFFCKSRKQKILFFDKIRQMFDKTFDILYMVLFYTL